MQRRVKGRADERISVSGTEEKILVCFARRLETTLICARQRDEKIASSLWQSYFTLIRNQSFDSTGKLSRLVIGISLVLRGPLHAFSKGDAVALRKNALPPDD